MSKTAELRIAVVTQRGLSGAATSAYAQEIEGVLCGLLDADLVQVHPRSGMVARALAPRARIRNAAARWPALQAYDLRPWSPEPYDVAVAVANDPWELSLLGAIPGWRRLAHAFVAIVNEELLGRYRMAEVRTLPVLRQLSHLYLTTATVVPTVADWTHTPVSFLPASVDVLAVAGGRPSSSRRIDVWNPGRRDPGQHASLASWAHARDAYYLFDTAGLGPIGDLAGHRRRYYDVASHSQCMVANYARCDEPDLTLGAEELGVRWFEALAAGCVILGQAPSGAAGSVLADAPGLVPMPLGAAAVPPELDELLASPERLDELLRGQRRAALAGHDVLHRWDVVARDLGLPELPGVRARRTQLAEAIAELDGSVRPAGPAG